MSVRLAPLVVGVGLVAVGVLLALRNLGVLPADVSIWPLVLIVAGLLVLVAGVTQERHGEPPAQSASAPLEGARAGRLTLKHGTGVLEVAGAAPPGLLYEGTFGGGVREERRRDGDRLEVTLRQASGGDWLMRQYRGLRWTLALSREVPIELEVQTGASRVRLDLEDLPVRALAVKTGASEVEALLPARGRCHVKVSAGAADVRLRVPTGTAASIETDTGLARTSIDEARFPPTGDGHRSPGFEAAEDRVEIELEGGVASFTVT